MKWHLVKETLRTTIAKLAGLPEGDVVWRNKKDPMVDPETGTQITLTITNFQGVGWDEFRKIPDPNINTNHIIHNNQNGIRTMTVTVLAECYQARDDESSMQYISNVHDALERIDVLDTLRDACGICVVDESNTRDHSRVSDDHEIDAASMDLFLSIMDNIALEDVGPDMGLDDLTTIDQVGIAVTINNTDGSVDKTIQIGPTPSP